MSQATANYDVFNGDADGICALHQLRLAEPRESRLITGVKRDIGLLARLAADPAVCAARITVLDISLEKNRNSLETLLERGNEIHYIDHHFAGNIPASPLLTTDIDPDPEICTGLIVDRLLAGRFRAWAVVAAFGDNLHDSAAAAATDLSLKEDEMAKLREIGELLNYNGYGRTLSDLHFSPVELYEAVRPFADPLEFYRESEVLGRLRRGFGHDMELARNTRPVIDTAIGRIYRFPATSWPRRAAGVFANEKAREAPYRAHALLVDNGDNTFMASVRAPLARKQGAVDLCRRFPTGGGRAAAAGINRLPAEQLDEFFHAFEEIFAP